MKIIIILALISIMLCRVEKNKVQLQGSLTLNSLLKQNFPQSYECSIFINGVDVATGTFSPSTLSNPTGPIETSGMVWNIPKGVSGDLQKITAKVPGANTQYYIPYRLFSSEFRYTNPLMPGSRKYIEVTVTLDSKNNVYSLKIYLPYSLIGWEIDDIQGNQICTWLNNYRKNQQMNAAAAKNIMLTVGSRLMNNLSMYNSAIGGEGKLKEAMDKVEIEIKQINTQLKLDQDALENNNKEIAKLENTLTLKKNNLKNLKHKVDLQQTTVDAKTKTLNELKGKQSASQTSSLKASINEDTKLLKQASETLKTVAPTADKLVLRAKESALSLKNDDFAKSLKEIYVGN